VFSLCEVGLRDPRFRRYPFLPVRQCAAHATKLAMDASGA
jgi:hypothetical protein